MMKKPNCGGALMKIIRITTIILFVCILNIGIFQVSAVTDAPYNGYYYDRFGNACPSPNQYVPVKTSCAKDFGIPSIGTVNDIASDGLGRLYILDADNSSIYQMDKELNYIKTIKIRDSGTELIFNDARGFTISENGGKLKIYIADTVHERILIADEFGNVINTIKKPNCDVISSEQSFLPIKLAVDKDNNIYVLCEHIYDGALLLNGEGEFLGFFGSNKVEINSKLITNEFWKKILGESFRDKFARNVPREYTNLIIDEKGFIYTTTLVTSGNSTQIRLLNWKSSDVLTGSNFGDSDNKYGKNKFIDIAVMKEGLFAALDTTRGRVFIYGEDGESVAIFGGNGSYSGNFRTAVAVESIEDNIYVYDLSTQSITMFVPTDYGRTLLSATRLYLKGNYEDAKPLWEDILKQNNSYEKAYTGIGRYYIDKKEYKKALSYFKKGGASEEYSDAFEQVRNINTRKWFPIYALLFVAVIVLVMYLLRDKGSYRNDYEALPTTFLSRLKYALFHPNKGIENLLADRKNMNVATVGILSVAFLISILNYRFTGFIFNKNDPDKMDIVTMFITITGMFAVFVVSNWLVTTMTDGNGKLLEIANVLAFSLLPMLTSQIINIVLSNILTANEGMFLTTISTVGYIWTVVLVVLGLAKIHQFSFSKNILMLALTIVGIAVILVLLLLCYSITKQIELFFSSVFEELITIIRR